MSNRILIMAPILLTAATANAERPLSTTRELPPHDRGGGILGARLGVLLPQAFSPLQASHFIELEGGYLLPFARRLLAVTASVAHSAPTTEGSGVDPRLPGGGYRYHIRQDQLILGLNIQARIPLGRLMPYLGLGPRLFLLRTTTTGGATGGTAFPESQEVSTEAGLGAPVGVDLRLGPGQLFAEGQLLYAPLAQRVTGEQSVGAFTLCAGYRLVL